MKPRTAEVLAYNLEAEGSRFKRARDGEEALLLVAEDVPDSVSGLDDAMRCRHRGLSAAEKTRQRTRYPVIMLSARSEDVDKVRGLETGADDYVVKPYSVNELMARVTHPVLRRVRPFAWAATWI